MTWDAGSDISDPAFCTFEEGWSFLAPCCQTGRSDAMNMMEGLHREAFFNVRMSFGSGRIQVDEKVDAKGDTTEMVSAPFLAKL